MPLSEAEIAYYRQSATKAVSELYKRHSTGCCCHIVTDDYIVDDDSIRFCMNHAFIAKHPHCVAALMMLWMLPVEERESAIADSHGTD